MRKKVSIFATVALCATMGSVYATWTYAQDEARKDTAGITQMITEKVEFEKGIIEVSTNTLELTIDQKDATYAAKITVGGLITVGYTPDELATDADKKIALQYKITAEGTTAYNGVAIYDLTNATGTLEENDDNSWTINGSDLGIEIGTFTLPTVTAYNEFQEAFEQCTLTITFSEVTA